MRMNKKERGFLEAARVARLATVDAEGQPHNVPVCPLVHRGKIYFSSDTGAKKVRNLEVNPQVALAFDDYVEDWNHLRGIMVQGRARRVSRRAFREVRKRLYAKYALYPSFAPIEASDAVIVEVTPERKFTWGFE